jgi:hypothetical protein
MGKIQNAVRRLANLPDWLNWLLLVVEPSVVLVIALALGYATYRLLFGQQPAGEEQTRFFFLIREVNDNWKAAVLLLILLFYRTVRDFLQRAEKAFGIEAPRAPVMVSTPQKMPPPQEEEQP